MNFQIEILIGAFIITTILALIIIPILKRLRVGQMERDDGPQSHLKKQGTPTMGGIIMMISITIASIAGIVYYTTGERGEVWVARSMIPLVIAAFGFGFIGLIDDFKKVVLKNTKGISPKAKMLGLLIISVFFVIYLQYVLHLGTETLIPFFKVYVELPILLYVPFVIFVMLAITNSVNLTDGVDGLAATICTVIITCLTVIAIILDVKEVIVFGSIAIGVCLGFLIFNLNPAKVMMGDTGSLLLGGIIGIMAIYLKMPFIILIVGIIPVLEAVSVTLQVWYFKKTGRRIFKMAPLHHHFELSGWKENKVVSIFAVTTLIASIIALCAI